MRFDSNGNLQTGDISIIDNIPPSVSLVTSSNSEGKYKLGDNISINVTFNEPVFIKDNQLEKIWTSQLGGSANEFAHGVSVAPDGNIFVTGTTYGDLDGNTKSGYNFDIFLSKFDSNGGKQWTRQLGIQGDLSSQYSKYAEVMMS